MALEQILQNGVYSIVRIAGTIEGQGAGETSRGLHGGNLWQSSAVQIRGTDSLLSELRNVLCGDYLQQYLQPRTKATWYFRKTVAGSKVTHVLLAVRTDDLNSVEEALLAPKSYQRSLKSCLMLMIVWGVLMLPTFMLTSPVAFHYLVQTIITLSFKGHVPHRKEIAFQVKQKLRQEGFSISS